MIEPMYPSLPVTRTRIFVDIGLYTLSFDKVSGDAEQRLRLCHAVERAAALGSGFCIFVLITNEGGSRQIQVEIPLRSIEKSRFWLATVTVVIPSVRATVHGIDSAAVSRRFLRHPFVNVLELRFGHEAARHARLIGRHDDPHAALVQQA
jgi:hypothetical protein